MKAFEIDLSSYKMPEDLPGAGQDYAVRESMAAIVIGPTLGLNGSQLILHAEVRTRIKTAPEEKVLLLPNEYAILRKSFEAVGEQSTIGFGLADLEMVRRVMEATEIEAEATPVQGDDDGPDDEAASVEQG